MMTTRWHDVTIPMRPGMTVWPGDPPFNLDPEQRISAGDHVNLSRISMCTHTGTHVDAPWHFCDNGPRLDEIDTQLFFGEALLIDLPDLSVIDADDLGPSPLPKRILLRTRNSLWPARDPFHQDFVAISADAAHRMVKEGVRLVGVDYLSVAPYKQEGKTTHDILLQNNILAVEGLLLAGLPAGKCQFVVLPLPLMGADGAPCRAFVGLEDSL